MSGANNHLVCMTINHCVELEGIRCMHGEVMLISIISTIQLIAYLLPSTHDSPTYPPYPSYPSYSIRHNLTPRNQQSVKTKKGATSLVAPLGIYLELLLVILVDSNLVINMACLDPLVSVVHTDCEDDRLCQLNLVSVVEYQLTIACEVQYILD